MFFCKETWTNSQKYKILVQHFISYKVSFDKKENVYYHARLAYREAEDGLFLIASVNAFTASSKLPNKKKQCKYSY